MTQAAKLKTAIRARVEKTGESYTAARRQVLAVKPQPKVLAPAPAKEPRVPRGELSERTTKKSTGHGLEHWFKVLDTFGAKNGHTKAADHLHSEYKIPAWHAQMITVTWERRRGFRQENQSCTGTFQVSVSRTLAAPTEWAAKTINDPRSRRAWLKGADPSLIEAMEDAFTQGKLVEQKKSAYARMRFKWLSSIVELRITGTGPGKCSVVADNSALPDVETVALRREAFSTTLDRLRDLAKERSPFILPS